MFSLQLFSKFHIFLIILRVSQEPDVKCDTAVTAYMRQNLMVMLSRDQAIYLQGVTVLNYVTLDEWKKNNKAKEDKLLAPGCINF